MHLPLTCCRPQGTTAAAATAVAFLKGTIVSGERCLGLSLAWSGAGPSEALLSVLCIAQVRRVWGDVGEVLGSCSRGW